MALTVGSLFTGIGGIDLGLERASMTIIWQSENDPYASRVLHKHWPGIPNHGDITTIDWTTVERPDLLCGGYPCQPFSLAGARQGADDPRHLWPHFARAVRHLRPDWILLENVPGHLSLGFGDVLADLAALGYDTEWESVPAAAVGAPHLRWRLYVVAYRSDPDGWGLEGVQELHSEPDTPRGDRPTVARDDGPHRPVADTDEPGLERREPTPRRNLPPGGGPPVADAPGVERWPALREGRAREAGGRIDFAEPADCGWWTTEPDVGRVAHGIPHRMDRLRTLGNAVVPQVAEWIGHHILEATT